MKNFDDLAIFRHSFKLIKPIYCLTKQLPVEERYGLISQINRSVISVSSNIAEGCSRSSDKELIHFVRIAKGSLNELTVQLRAVNEIYNLDTYDLLQSVNSVGKMIFNYIKSFEEPSSRRSAEREPLTTNSEARSASCQNPSGERGARTT